MKKLFPALTILAALGLFCVHYLAFIYVPMERTMGASQRIFYIHLPSVFTCYIGFLVCFVASLGYLINRKSRWDIVAVSAAEVGLIFGMIVLTTGPLWARAAWGVYWKWDPRLTTMAILFLIFSGYWVLRAFGGNSAGVRTFSAVLAVFGTPQIYFVHIAVEKWQGSHPPSVTMAPEMRMTWMVNFFIFLLVFFLLLRLRYRVRRDALTVSVLKRRLARMGGR